MDDIWSLMFQTASSFVWGCPKKNPSTHGATGVADRWACGGHLWTTCFSAAGIRCLVQLRPEGGHLKIGGTESSKPIAQSIVRNHETIMKPSETHCNFGVPKKLRQPQNCRFFLDSHGWYNWILKMNGN